MLTHHKISHRGGDVIDKAHRPIGLHLRAIDFDPFKRVFGTREPDDFFFGVPLLNEAELLFTLHLGGKAQIIKGLSCHHTALELPCLNRFARDRIGLSAHILLGHTSRFLNRSGSKLHHLDLAVGSFRITSDFKFAARLFNNHPVRATHFIAHHIPIIHCTLIGNDLIGVQHEKRL